MPQLATTTWFIVFVITWLILSYGLMKILGQMMYMNSLLTKVSKPPRKPWTWPWRRQ